MAVKRILGGGISGLAAAIQLKKAGFDVEVHERKGFCGKKTNDFQFLENWTFEEDPLVFLERIGIETGFYIKPKFSQEFRSPSLRKYVGRSADPLMYLVKRGRSEDSIDQCLKDQAQRKGVTIKYHSNLRPEAADIIATGIRKPTFVTTGVKFRVSHPDTSIILLDNNISSKCYSYFVANEGMAEIVCANPTGTPNSIERLKGAVRKFEEMLSISVKEVEERFSSVVNFGFLHSARIDGRCFVGEAAGFQDQLAGFGMRYAFRSGYLAATSIIEGLDYDKLWKKDLLKKLRISSRNRSLYNRLGNKHYERLIGLLCSTNPVVRVIRGGYDLRLIMKRIYNSNMLFALAPLIFTGIRGKVH